MTQKIGVVIIHGVGDQQEDYAEPVIARLQRAFAELLPRSTPNPEEELQAVSIYWAPVVQDKEDELWRRLSRGGSMDFRKLRRFLIDFAADAIAYEQIGGRRWIYDQVHKTIARRFGELAISAGPKAPLCIIAHSLGTVIMSNYLYDLQFDAAKGGRLIGASVKEEMSATPLERGETLAFLYTLGSPLALWGLGYDDFGLPITCPSPKLGEHHPQIRGEWVNFYDQDDILGYPLKSINRAYRKAVKADRVVNAGGILSSWNPMSHMAYWFDADIILPIAQTLARNWKKINRRRR